jgi:hypothetical protein
MNYVNLYFAGIFWKWAFRQIGWMLLFLLVFVTAVVEGQWDLVAWMVAIGGTGAAIGYALHKLFWWLILLHEPPRKSMEQLASEAREIREKAQGDVWFDPREISSRPPWPTKSAPVRQAPVRSMSMLEICELESKQRLLRK